VLPDVCLTTAIHNPPSLPGRKQPETIEYRLEDFRRLHNSTDPRCRFNSRFIITQPQSDKSYFVSLSNMEYWIGKIYLYVIPNANHFQYTRKSMAIQQNPQNFNPKSVNLEDALFCALLAHIQGKNGEKTSPRLI
jgi:hypothetical protein